MSAARGPERDAPDAPFPSSVDVVVTTPDGRWRLIPFPDGKVSVGVVMPSSRFARRDGTVERPLGDRVGATPEVRDHLDGASRLGEVRAIPDSSCRTPRTSGDGSCRVGDAWWGTPRASSIPSSRPASSSR